jgi:hypothetical protein
MPKLKTTTFRVRDKGGTLGGKEITFQAPEFSLDEFLHAPNAEEFIKNAYKSAAKKIAREVEERKNGSVKADLASYEMIVARSLNFTKADITRWLQSRDWQRISLFKNPDGLRRSMENWLPNLAMRVNHWEPQASRNVAVKVVAALADKPDPVAEYLFVVLTVERPDDIELPDDMKLVD